MENSTVAHMGTVPVISAHVRWVTKVMTSASIRNVWKQGSWLCTRTSFREYCIALKKEKTCIWITAFVYKQQYDKPCRALIKASHVKKKKEMAKTDRQACRLCDFPPFLQRFSDKEHSVIISRGLLVIRHLRWYTVNLKVGIERGDFQGKGNEVLKFPLNRGSTFNPCHLQKICSEMNNLN